MQNKLRIAITGNIASGKTLFSNLLLGCIKEASTVYVNADEMAHRVLEDMKKEVIRQLGEGILNRGGRISREKIAGRIFSSDRAYSVFEKIIKEELKKRAIQAIMNFKGDILIFDAPLLFEYKLEKLFDYIITITAPPELLIDRFIKKTGYSRALAENILGHQMPQDVKAGLSDIVIKNTGTLEELKKGAEEVWERIKNEKLYNTGSRDRK